MISRRKKKSEDPKSARSGAELDSVTATRLADSDSVAAATSLETRDDDSSSQGAEADPTETSLESAEAVSEEQPNASVADTPEADTTKTGTSTEEKPPVDPEHLRACVEAILFAAGEPVPRKRLRRVLKEASKRDVDNAILRLEAELVSTGRAFGLVEDASGLRLLTRPEYAPYVARLRGEKRKVRLSQAAFETLAVIAYRQPIRRADLETIRGVQCGAILKNLTEWNLIRIIGRDESLGRPLLYGTSTTFLEQFGLPSLKQLPEPEQLQDLAGDAGLELFDDRRQMLFDLEEDGPPPQEDTEEIAVATPIDENADPEDSNASAPEEPSAAAEQSDPGSPDLDASDEFDSTTAPNLGSADRPDDHTGDPQDALETARAQDATDKEDSEPDSHP